MPIPDDMQLRVDTAVALAAMRDSLGRIELAIVAREAREAAADEHVRAEMVKAAAQAKQDSIERSETRRYRLQLGAALVPVYLAVIGLIAKLLLG